MESLRNIQNSFKLGASEDKLSFSSSYPCNPRRGTIIVLTKGATNKLHLLFDSMAKAMERLVSGYSEEELEI